MNDDLVNVLIGWIIASLLLLAAYILSLLTLRKVKRAHAAQVAHLQAEFRRLNRSDELRLGKEVARLMDKDEYAVVRKAGSLHPCQVTGCTLSQEEHHRLAYGYMGENAEMKRQLRSMEGGSTGAAQAPGR